MGTKIEWLRNRDGSQGTTWDPVRVELIESKLEEPLHWRKPRMVFVNSMSDLFLEKLSDEAIDRMFAVMALCSQHTFLVLTKRAERMRGYVGGKVVERLRKVEIVEPNGMKSHLGSCFHTWPLPNVWLGEWISKGEELSLWPQCSP